MKKINVYSKVYLKSGNVVKTTLATDVPDVDGLEEEMQQNCKSLAKLYIGESDEYEGITWGNLGVIKGNFAFRSENVEAAVVTYEIFDE